MEDGHDHEHTTPPEEAQKVLDDLMAEWRKLTEFQRSLGVVFGQAIDHALADRLNALAPHLERAQRVMLYGTAKDATPEQAYLEQRILGLEAELHQANLTVEDLQQQLQATLHENALKAEKLKPAAARKAARPRKAAAR